MSNNTKKSKSKIPIDKNKLDKLWEIYDNEESSLECLYSKDNTSNDICSICKNNLLICDEGYYMCSNKNCGIIYKNTLDSSPEWRFYGTDDNNNKDPTRCGMPINPLLEESSYSCKVLSNNFQTYEMRKIRRYTEWQAMPYREKSQYDEFMHIINISNMSGIPKMIIDDAIRYYKKVSEAKTFRGLNRDSIIAASIYVSCRLNNYPRSAKEIATIFHLDNNSATKGCKNALSIINNMEYKQNDIVDDINVVKLSNTTPSSFISRYCSKLDLNSEITNLCGFVAYKIEKQKLIQENTPQSIAGGIIYFVCQVCNLNINKVDITNVSKISEVTINKCYKKLQELKDRLIPSSIIENYS